MVDDRGTLVADWTLPPVSECRVEGCSIQPGESSEEGGDRQALEVEFTVFMPPGTPITAYSKVDVYGTPYAVEGKPKRTPSATGRLDHVRVDLVAWHG
jgi:hypothetical protein